MADKYTLKLVVDDSAVRALEARLNRLMSMGGAPGPGGSATQQQGGLQGFMQGMGGGGGGKMGFVSLVTKLAGPLGILVTLTTVMVTLIKGIFKNIVKSSPMLQAMLKLLGTAFMFFLRPIGDFLGFFLRPFVVVILRIAVEWYRIAGPFARDAGAFLGKALSGGFAQDIADAIWKALTGGAGGGAPPAPGSVAARAGRQGYNPSASAANAGASITNAANQIGAALAKIPPGITSSFSAINFAISSIDFSPITNWVNAAGVSLGDAWDSLIASITGSGTPIQNSLTGAWQGLLDFYNNTIKPALDQITPIWNQFTGLFTVTFNPGLALVKPVWDTLVGFFRDKIEPALTDILPIWDSLKDFFITNIQNALGQIKPIWDLFEGFFVDSILPKLNEIKPIWDSLMETLNGIADFFKFLFSLVNNPAGTAINSVLQGAPTPAGPLSGGRGSRGQGGDFFGNIGAAVSGAVGVALNFFSGDPTSPGYMLHQANNVQNAAQYLGRGGIHP